MLDAAGNAWSGMREATVDVMQYQYGNEVASVAADSADVVEGVANMGVAMKYAQPTQVRWDGWTAVAKRQKCAMLHAQPHDCITRSAAVSAATAAVPGAHVIIIGAGISLTHATSQQRLQPDHVLSCLPSRWC